MIAYNDSSFNITSSSFTNNSAGCFVGVIATFDSSCNITSSTITNSSASCVGDVSFVSSSL